MAKTLDQLRTEFETASAHVDAVIERLFPGADRWTWFRALSRINGTIGRHNEDTSRDADLAANAEIKVTYDVYISAIQAFYRARDGERGFLGGRGM